jgi:hypothetical protein
MHILAKQPVKCEACDGTGVMSQKQIDAQERLRIARR